MGQLQKLWHMYNRNTRRKKVEQSNKSKKKKNNKAESISSEFL